MKRVRSARVVVGEMVGADTRLKLILISYLSLLILMVGCERPDPEVTLLAPATVVGTPVRANVPPGVSSPVRFLPPTAAIQLTRTQLPTYHGIPTPDPTRQETSLEPSGYRDHVVSFGDTLTRLAQLYATSVEALMDVNELSDSDVLAIGQILLVPAGGELVSPSFKLIPDSELVYGPRARGFDPREAVATYGGFLLTYSEEVEGQLLDGPEVVQLIADRFSVNPRLLMVLLEYRAGWITHPTTDEAIYPLGYIKPGYEGLYGQLRWAANSINRGFYGHLEGGLKAFDVGDQSRVSFAQDINAGTVGLQFMLAAHTDATYEDWLKDVAPNGLYATFNLLYGNPFAYTVDPLWPPILVQPALSLPWPIGDRWYFTGGPHGGWASGSAWAALDFAPRQGASACYTSDEWVTAVSDGLVTRSSFGAVVIDLDGDRYSGTGWAIIYMHLDTRDRSPEGTVVKVGDRLGHPSCEGGFVSATHLHIARTYNGRWVSADGVVPFVLAGWESVGLREEYDGLFVRGEVVKEACDCMGEGNAITAE